MSKRLIKEIEQLYWIRDLGDGSSCIDLITKERHDELAKCDDIYEEGYMQESDGSFTIKVYDDYTVEVSKRYGGNHVY